MTEAVLAKVRQICKAYLDPNELLPVAQKAIEDAEKTNGIEAEIQSIQSKIESMTSNLDRMYMDRLSGMLAEADFQRVYLKEKENRAKLEENLKSLQEHRNVPVWPEVQARELVQRFLDSAYASRELLVSLIERVELSEEKHVYIKFRFRELDNLLIQSSS